MCAKAVRTVRRAGQTWWGRSALLDALKAQICPRELTKADAEPSGKLTAREEQILELIGGGLSNKEIGRRLDISDKTVKTHLHRIYVKLQASGRFKAYASKPMGSPNAVRWPTLHPQDLVRAAL